MKRLATLVSVAIIATMLVSCSSKAKRTPSEVVTEFYTQIQEGKYTAALTENGYEYANLATEDEKSEYSTNLFLMGDKIAKPFNDRDGLKSFEVSNEIIADENNATVDVKLVYGNGEEETITTSLGKVEDKGWFVIYTIPSAEDAVADSLTESLTEEEEVDASEEEIVEEEVVEEVVE